MALRALQNEILKAALAAPRRPGTGGGLVAVLASEEDDEPVRPLIVS